MLRPRRRCVFRAVQKLVVLGWAVGGVKESRHAERNG